MAHFCNLDDLRSESDVEQKVIWPLLTTPSPFGLGLSSSDVATKANIRALTIDKGAAAKLYFPDYGAIIAGLPMMIVEAKRPDEDVLDGLREARLYAAELNARFPTGINPCFRIIASNGLRTISSAWDSATPDCDVAFDALHPASNDFANLLDRNSRAVLQKRADELRDSLATRPLHSPLAILGGVTVRNEEVGHNTFGATLALDYKHLFNPHTREERAFIVRHAYVRSLRRDRYVEPIDRLIRAAAPPSVTDARLIDDTSAPIEIISQLRRHKSLEHQVLLLVGGVGAGKSTFVDFIREVAQSNEVRDRTTWVHVDLNYAPLADEHAYRWVTDELTAALRGEHPDTDFDDIETLQRLYGVELQRIRKGPLSLLDPKSMEYKTRWVDEVRKLQDDKLSTAKAMARFLCGERGKLLIVVLDNCDKRTRDEQLRMFQIAQWAQREFQCLIFLPIRDVTYDHHRNDPPLDTALKDLVFRIEPPQFAKVLQQRVKLALAEMAKDPATRLLTYELPNGMKVVYPRSDQGMYLAAILRSLYEHDRLIRRMITGLAGRDIRRAMEIFLEFCTSGHIGEHEILTIRHSSGAHSLPYHVVVRVLLRMNRRFYEGDKSYVKNVFQCVPQDSLPDYFVRLAILRWLNRNWRARGPTGIKGYHQIQSMLQELVTVGHDANVLRRELTYLVRAKCILTEHQRTDAVADEDLVSIAPAGVVHLELTRNWDYLAACSEELWYDGGAMAHRIAERIGNHGQRGHYTRQTTVSNAADLVEYLKAKREGAVRNEFCRESLLDELHSIDDSVAAVERAKRVPGTELFVGNLPWRIDSAELDIIFSEHGTVLSAQVVTDPESGRSKGFGFVRMAPEAAEVAIRKLNGETLYGRQLTVRVGKEKSERAADGTP